VTPGKERTGVSGWGKIERGSVRAGGKSLKLSEKGSIQRIRQKTSRVQDQGKQGAPLPAEEEGKELGSKGEGVYPDRRSSSTPCRRVKRGNTAKRDERSREMKKLESSYAGCISMYFGKGNSIRCSEKRVVSSGKEPDGKKQPRRERRCDQELPKESASRSLFTTYQS